VVCQCLRLKSKLCHRAELTLDLAAVTPDEAAKSLAEWIEKDFDISKTGTYWAPRGPA
jgi:hypothetical protein